MRRVRPLLLSVHRRTETDHGWNQECDPKTPALNREVLHQVLKRHRQTLKAWSDEQLEMFVEPKALLQPMQMREIGSATELADAAQVTACLKAVDWAFTDADTGYLTHDLHPYPAKFIPQIPAHLIAGLSLPGELVLDPFHGSATTAVEALRLGRRAICIDANPLFETIGRAKTADLTEERETTLDELQIAAASFASGIKHEDQSISLADRYSQQVPDVPNMSHWYSPIAIGELALVRYLIGQIDDRVVADIACLAFSKVALKVSYQDAETRYARREKEIVCGATLALFIDELEAVRRKLRIAAPTFRYGDVQFYTMDAREIPQSILPENCVDLLVTSPPYPNANDYHLYHRFRLFWLGHDPRLLGKQEIGSHLRHQRESTGFDGYISDMRACLDRFALALRPGRYAAFVVGDGLYGGKICRTNEALAAVGESVGLEPCGDITRPIHKTRRHLPDQAGGHGLNIS